MVKVIIKTVIHSRFSLLHIFATTADDLPLELFFLIYYFGTTADALNLIVLMITPSQLYSY